MSKEVRRQLQEAAEKHQLTHLDRALPGSDELEGFVVEVTPSWTVIAECNRLALDGFVALRTRDIVKVRRQGSRDPSTTTTSPESTSGTGTTPSWTPWPALRPGNEWPGA
ncbi:hypothetical protein [Streptomyces sp. NEAU-L66]|uniref:hypothetical protein n=1 Tax=Streptomyces sp. NEAU-L66 TaxID=3390812 RepID=UPI0039C64239